MYMHDNAKPHVSKLTNEWLKDNNINVIDWPAYSPDLNPIENVWIILVRMVYANGKQYNMRIFSAPVAIPLCNAI